jgi:uncharacterized RDD family membrane protein YckC
LYPENNTRVLATLTSRLLAQLVDTAVAFGLMFVLVFVVVFSASIVSSPGQAALVLTVVLACVACMVYVLFSDGMPGGRSLGKRLLGIEVIHATTGRPCTYSQSLVRNLVLSFLGPIDCVCIVGGRQQRLGDRAAQTIVVNTLAREPAAGAVSRRAMSGTVWTDLSPPLEPPVYRGTIVPPAGTTWSGAQPRETHAPVAPGGAGSRPEDETANPLAARPAGKTPSGKDDDWIPF